MSAGYLNLVIAMFPNLVLREKEQMGHKINRSFSTYMDGEGQLHKVIRPVDVVQDFLAGMRIRKVILRRNAALSLEQIELLRSLQRVILKGEEYISVE